MRISTEWINLQVADGTTMRGYVAKPIDFEALVLIVHRAMERQNLMEEVRTLRTALDQRYGFEGIVGHSKGFLRVLDQAARVSQRDATVLAQGETGTGKELVAREIHNRCRRKDKPLIRVNCASVPKDLYESEFFGHARGSFTGAIKDRAGRFEAADGGTLFLDEIGEIPLDLQSKLLRVLQEKRYERVGNNFLQICKQLDVLSGATGANEPLVTPLREWMGVMQHHDAVAGTEKQHVADDYALKLYKSVAKCQHVVADGLSKLSAKQVGGCLGVKLSEVYLAKYKVSALVKKEIPALEEWAG